jgi:hypothetical protein
MVELPKEVKRKVIAFSRVVQNVELMHIANLGV